MAVDEECSKFCLRRQRHDCFDNLWYVHDGTIVGDIFRLVCNEEVSSWSASRAGFRKVWGIALSIENHVTSTLSYNCIGVCGGVVNQLLCLLHCSHSRVCLLWCSISQCSQHGCVYRSRIVEERSNDFLNKLFIWLAQDFWHVLLLWKLSLGCVDRFGVGVGLVL